jgi:peroxiredoxin
MLSRTHASTAALVEIQSKTPMSTSSRHRVAMVLMCTLFLASCDSSESTKPSRQFTYSVTDHKTIQFKDVAASNTKNNFEIDELVFTDIEGNDIRLKDFHGKKNVVLVITRGYSGSICLYCTTQTSRLITNYEKFAQRETEVVVAFPVRIDADQKQLSQFQKDALAQLDTPVENVPFPILLDFQLKAVDQLGINGNLAKPTTLILDKQGRIRFAYVGNLISDRPSINSLLKRLDALNESQPKSSAAASDGKSAPPTANKGSSDNDASIPKPAEPNLDSSEEKQGADGSAKSGSTKSPESGDRDPSSK